MSASQPVSNQSGEVASKPSTLPGTIATWGLPLMAVSLVVGSLGMAVRSGQMLWMNTGIITYVVCVAMWGVIRIRHLMAKAVIPSGDLTPGGPLATSGKMERAPGESAGFYRFANWFLPLAALVALTAASLRAALTNQQKWFTAGIVSFAGFVLVWLATLFMPALLPRLLGQTASAPGSEKEPRPVRPSGYIAQLLLSILSLGSALLYAANTARVRWLAIAIGCFVVYQIVASVQAIAFHQNGVALRWTVIPGVGLGVLILGLGWAVDLHRVSWILAAIIGACGCVTAWMIPAMAPDGKLPSAPNRIPALTIAALLVTLGLAFYGHQISALQALLLALFGGLAVCFSWMFITAVERDGAPQVESNWGGIGGGMGGWRCSPSILYALCTMVFALCTAFALIGGSASKK